MNHNDIENIDLVNETVAENLNYALEKAKNTMLTEVPVVDYCNDCFEEVSPGKKYCNSTCACNHHSRMASMGVTV